MLAKRGLWAYGVNEKQQNYALHLFRLKIVPSTKTLSQALPTMNAFVQVLLMACEWKDKYYVAFQSTGTQFYLDVYMKKAVTLMSAMSTATKWIKQPYQMPWTQVLYYVWYDTCGAEIILWTNDLGREVGLKLGYRYLENPTKWHYANVLVPSMSKLEMQMSYLQWGHAFENYAWNYYCETDPYADDIQTDRWTGRQIDRRTGR